MTYNSTSSNNHAALYSLPCAFSSSNLLHISSSNRASIPFICGKQQGAFLLSKTRIRYPHTAPTVKMSSSETSIPFVIAESDSAHKVISLTSSDGAEIKAYLATPPDITSVSGRGVILMTDVLGYENPDTRAVARLLASRGLPTIVPDLFRDHPWTETRPKSEYEDWRLQQDVSRIRHDVLAAYQELRRLGLASSLGMIGFCFGGGRLMDEISLAEAGLNPKAAVAYYPTRFDAVEVGRRASCCLLVITGDNDPLVPMDVVYELQGTVEKENRTMDDFEIQVVEGAGHAFAHHPKTELDKIDSEISLSQGVEYLCVNL